MSDIPNINNSNEDEDLFKEVVRDNKNPIDEKMKEQKERLKQHNTKRMKKC